MIQKTGDLQFEEAVLKAELPVLVEFHAPWTGACRALTPILERVDRKFNGALKVVRVNVDENPVLVSDYRINAYPSLFLFSQGKIIEQLVGTGKIDEVIALLQRHGVSKDAKRAHS